MQQVHPFQFKSGSYSDDQFESQVEVSTRVYDASSLYKGRLPLSTSPTHNIIQLNTNRIRSILLYTRDMQSTLSQVCAWAFQADSELKQKVRDLAMELFAKLDASAYQVGHACL